MTEEPKSSIKVNAAEIQAAMDRDDYAWLCEHVFIPTVVDMLRAERTVALMNGPRPRSRRRIGRGRSHRTRINSERISPAPA
ncbi:MAG TPA: hypothetical protein VKP67_02925 [Xanthobacteraceae bacterium]|nr:hypothetical protein [Xanthobacteraceae bacterium]